MTGTRQIRGFPDGVTHADVTLADASARIETSGPVPLRDIAAARPAAIG